MKYLFFFNGQPLLLCCVCYKIAIQDFLTGLHKKNKKNLRFHRRAITRRYFTELQKNYGIVPQIQTDLPTEYNPSVFHRELQKNYGIVPQSPTGIPTAVPTSNTDGFTHIPKRTHVWHASICTNTDGFFDVQCRRNHRRIYAHPEAHACLTRVRLHEYRRIEKFGGIFECFLVHVSINFRRNLMPPTTIKFCR